MPVLTYPCPYCSCRVYKAIRWSPSAGTTVTSTAMNLMSNSPCGQVIMLWTNEESFVTVSSSRSISKQPADVPKPGSTTVKDAPW